MKTYSNKKLEELANNTLIFKKPSAHYTRLLKKSLAAKGWDYEKLSQPNESHDICHTDLFFDLCEMVNELAQLVLDEREKRKTFLKDIKHEISAAIENASKD